MPKSLKDTAPAYASSTHLFLFRREKGCHKGVRGASEQLLMGSYYIVAVLVQEVGGLVLHRARVVLYDEGLIRS